MIGKRWMILNRELSQIINTSAPGSKFFSKTNNDI